jgi:hypothetical protein
MSLRNKNDDTSKAKKAKRLSIGGAISSPESSTSVDDSSKTKKAKRLSIGGALLSPEPSVVYSKLKKRDEREESTSEEEDVAKMIGKAKDALPKDISSEALLALKDFMSLQIKQAVADDRSRSGDGERYHKVRKNNTNFSITHTFMTHENLCGIEASKTFNQWFTMVITSGMTLQDRNLAMDERLRDHLSLVSSTYSALETERLSRDVPLGDNWELFDNDELSRFIKFNFKTIDSKSDTFKKKSGFEELLVSMGPRITTSILNWIGLDSYEAIVGEISSIQDELKELYLSSANHNDLIVRVIKSISNKVSDTRTHGSVQLLNNLNTVLLRKIRESGKNDNNTCLFYDDVYAFLKHIIVWSGSVVQHYNNGLKIGINSIPIQQNAPLHHKESRSSSIASTYPTPALTNNSSSKTPALTTSQSHSQKKKEFVVDKELFDITPCSFCGRYHLKGHTKCEIPLHADLNRSANTWATSSIGLRYKTLGRLMIKPYSQLNENKDGFTKIPPVTLPKVMLV